MAPVCSICRDSDESEDIAYTLNCGHVYHESCVVQWLSHNPTCPVCRQVVTNHFKLFFDYPVEDKNAPSILKTKFKETLTRMEAQWFKELNNYKKQLADIKMDQESVTEELRKTKGDLMIQKKKIERLENVNKSLQAENGLLNSLRVILTESVEEAEKCMERYDNVKSVVTFSVALKRALVTCNKRNRELTRQMAEIASRPPKRPAAVMTKEDYLANVKKCNAVEVNSSCRITEAVDPPPRPPSPYLQLKRNQMWEDKSKVRNIMRRVKPPTATVTSGLLRDAPSIPVIADDVKRSVSESNVRNGFSQGASTSWANHSQPGPSSSFRFQSNVRNGFSQGASTSWANHSQPGPSSSFRFQSNVRNGFSQGASTSWANHSQPGPSASFSFQFTSVFRNNDISDED